MALENNQFGFRKGHSTSHGITHLHETIIQNIEKKKVCVALFIDLKSAFDTITTTTTTMKYLLSAKSLRPRVKKAALSAPAWTVFHAGRQIMS